MNILVTGANGQLGNCIRKVTHSSKDNYIFTDISALDITDSTEVHRFVADNKIEVIINCAAYTNVDKAEHDEKAAKLINTIAVGNLAQALKSNDGFLIHISTDYVFGGSCFNTPISESEPTNPTGVYGLTKLNGEKIISDIGCKYLVFRTAWLYSEYGKNFVKTMLDLTSQKSELKVVFDQVGSPTYAKDLADAIYNIVENRKYEDNQGIYHFSNEGVCSWFDFTKAIVSIAGIGDCKIIPCHSDEFPSSVVRPSYSVLDKTKYKKTFEKSIPYWIDSLKRCMNNLMG